jgi:hypothetical protein
MNELQNKLKEPVIKSINSFGPPTVDQRLIHDVYQAIPMKTSVVNVEALNLESRKSS